MPLLDVEMIEQALSSIMTFREISSRKDCTGQEWK